MRNNGFYFNFKYCYLILFYIIFISHPLFAKFSSYPFLSNRTFQSFCNHPNQPGNVKLGDTVFADVYNIKVGKFLDRWHNRIQSPYILVSHGGLSTMPGQFKKYLDDPKLIAWFSKNGDESLHPKMFIIPIGIGGRDNYPTDFIGFMKKFIPTVTPPVERRSDKLLYINMSLAPNPKERNFVFNYFKNAEFAYYGKRVSNENFIKELSQFRFVASPRGGGVDCHRTWEALYVGTIPIITRSHISHMFEDLPVLIIDDWKQITREFLEEKFKEITSKTYNLDKLYADYWFEKIRKIQTEARKKK